ncbi:hypothetical protein Tco_0138415 [Tanacetum coccineum]
MVPSVMKMSVPATAKEKTNKKNDVKARSLLLMALPNEHQLTFSQYHNAKTMFAAIETRFGVLDVVISQEDLNSKFLSSLPPEWNTHVVVWMNKPEIKTMSIDDLYNNFKIVKQKVKKFVGASNGAQNLAFMTTPSTSSTNHVNTAMHAYEVSTASPDVNIASPQVSTASFSDNVVYAFMVENPNGSNLLQQDLEKIHEDDLEAMDLKWQLSLLSMRAKRTLPAWNLKLHKGTRKASSEFKTTPGSKQTMKTHPQRQSTTYKRGLATVEEKLITYRKNKVLFSEEVAVLKREVACKDYEINVLKSEFDKVKQEKEGIEIKIEKFDKASKDLDKLPKKLDFSYSSLDEFKEPEFKGYGSEDSKKESNVVCDKKSDNSKENSKNSLVKEQVSKDTSSFVESSLNVDKETIFPVDKKVESVNPKDHEKPVKKSVRYAEMYRSQTPRGNQRNWNGQKSNQLGSDFVMYNKACFICGSFNHVQAQCKYHQRERMVYGNNYNRVNYNYTTKRTHPNAQRNMVPRAVLMKTDLKPFNTARTVNTAHPKSTVFSAKQMSCFPKIAQSTVRRPFQSKTALTNKRFTHKVNTAKAQAVNTARPQAVNTARLKTVKTARPNSAIVNAVRGKPQQDDTGFVDSGCSRHMTGNIAYLSDFKEFDRGYKITTARQKHVKRGRDTKIPQSSGPPVKVGDEAVHKELGDRMERAATIASSLEAEQDSLRLHLNNPMIYLSQEVTHLEAGRTFWVTAKANTVNGEHQLQALIDKKKVIIMESRIRSDLHLEDAGGTDCLPTTTIFEELARMGYEKPSQKLIFYKDFFSPQWKFLIHTITQCLSAKSTEWNEFSSTMASLIICLATNQKFNLSKYIFDAMVKHLDGGVKFMMYPQFLQVFINQQLGDMSRHKKIYVNPSHIKKIFANMKKEGKDFSGRVTPLFETMMVQPPTPQERKQRQDTIVTQEEIQQDDSVPTPSNDPPFSGEDIMQLSELILLCTNLQKQVLDLEKGKDAQAKEVVALKKRVQKLEKKKKSRPTRLQRLRKVGQSSRVESSKDKYSLGDHKDAFKQGRSIEDFDKDADVSLVDDTQGRSDDEEKRCVYTN